MNTKNILFVSLYDFDSINCRAIYPDLVRKLAAEGNRVTVLSPVEKRNVKSGTSDIITGENYRIMKPVIGNIQKTAYIEKGISTLTLSRMLISYCKKNLPGDSFDLIICTTPPPTFGTLVAFLKRKYCAVTYLLLKDIWPQGLIDDHAVSKTGLTAPIYWFYRWHEKRLYRVSDYIGCMSKANVDYILKHNNFIPPESVHINPNSIEPLPRTAPEIAVKAKIREKFGVPAESLLLFYGGNLGIDQAVLHIIECIRKCEGKLPCHFVICGSGTHYHLLEEFRSAEKPSNLTLLSWLDKESYDLLLSASDAGLIFLDYGLTTPNFPSRLLTYMEYSKPVLACTDTATDMGAVIDEGGFGFWCPSNDADKFAEAAKKLIAADREALGANALRYLNENYTVDVSLRIISEVLENR